MNLWLVFLGAALAVVIAGNRVSLYGDLIALKSGIGQALVGGILIAGVTSLPELVTTSSAAYIGAVDLAVGNVFGSNIFNLAMLALMDLVQGAGPLMLEVHSRHILTAMLGIILSVSAALFIMINHLTFFNLHFWGVGIGSLVIVLIYILGTRLNYRYEGEDNQIKEKEKKIVNLDISLHSVYPKFILAAVVIIVAGYTLSVTADKIAAVTGLEETFMGSIMVAAATSLPELVTVLAAMKIGAYNMATANVFGSNIFNILVLVVADVMYRPGPILAAVSLTNVITALLGIILASIAIIGLFYRSHKSFLALGWDSVAILIIYLFGVYLIINMGIAI
ncbi:MAG: sodium:calcium antiporter [Bacillota bacterium]